MAKTIHTTYVIFLIAIGALSTLVIGTYGADYYTTSLQDRPFHSQYEVLKPTGIYGHGFGIIGTLMITFGVVMYSSRKRWRAMANLGKIKNFLEFHIFLCLLGPILVLYHTTFKFGGLVAVSFWSMIAVVLSGLVGRYFYVQIPRGIQGNELSVAELTAENERLGSTLKKNRGFDTKVLEAIDTIALPGKNAAHMSLVEVLNFFVVNDITRRARLHRIFSKLERQGLRGAVLSEVRALATRRVILTRRIAFLQQFRQVFYYWHVIHLPFSIVMFLILFVHVGVAIAFGYTWIF